MPEAVTLVVSSERVDVLAPPAELMLSVGVGASGLRGSKTWAGRPTPMEFFAALGEQPSAGDIYISTSTQKAHQLVATPAGTTWSLLFDIPFLLESAAVPAVESAIDSTLNKWLVLGASDPIPVGTPVNTIIFRTAG